MVSNKEIKQNRKIKYPHSGKIKVSTDDSDIKLFTHQNEAIQILDKILENNKNPFAGLLVLPTGAGKTLTATYWLLKNYVDNKKKILWIAHRHELLEQAKHSFEQLAHQDILKNRSSFNYRIISGLHDKPVHIKSSDDIIISSKDSIRVSTKKGSQNRGFNYLYDNWIKHNPQDIFLVVDEAHHATAKTYRHLIDKVNENVKEFRMLGLTATPFRTAEYEKGLLVKVFPDDIIYKIDLRTLIDRGILSEPHFKEIKTDIDMTKILDEKELDNIKFFDIDSIGEGTAKSIAENRERNHCIVDHYIKNKSTYKQTLVFALNIDNAIALNSLFNSHEGVKSEYVVSAIVDKETGVTRKEDNTEKIKQFRNGELDVLVNVNILTEGTDLPQIQTIFLARPTISTILMTQMIGRGLRGEEAEGTKKAYIVGFIDEWKDKVSWVNPEKLFIEKTAVFPPEKDIPTPETFIRLVSIQKIEEFAKLIDQTVDTTELESLEFIERIPVGLYSFTILEPADDEERGKNCEILVYDNIKQDYIDFLNSLSDFFEENNISEDTLNEKELTKFSKEIEDKFFYGSERYPGYVPDDIKDILLFYAKKEVKPDYIELTDREKFDLTQLGKIIVEKDFRQSEKKKFIEECWDKNENEWKVFFGFNQKYFLNELDLIIRKIEFPDSKPPKPIHPEFVPEDRDIEDLSMSELRKYCPKYWKKLSDSIYEKFRNKEGYYYSALSGFQSKSKLKFQIDHKKPMSKGGKTVFGNLQLLTRSENAKKGDKEYKLTDGLTYEKNNGKKPSKKKSTNAKPIHKMSKRVVTAEIKKLRKKEKASSLTPAERKRLEALKERGHEVGASWG